MKKILAVILAFLFLFTAGTAFADGTPMLAGGWTAAEDHALTEETAAIFNKAFEGLAGAGYEPIALLGTQVVAGINYKFFAKQTIVTAEPVISYGIVTVYVDLEGNASFTDYVPVIAEAEEALCGGYAPVDDWTVTEEISGMIANALEGLTGAGYEGIAVIGTQVVAGLNYQILAKQTLVTAEPVVNYGVLTIYKDLEGNASFTGFTALDELPAEEIAE